MDSSITELTAVQQVCLLTVRLRALDARSDTPLLGDAVALQVAESLGLDLTSRVARSMVLVHAVRDKMLDRLVSRFIAEHPTAVVVDLGCGLDTRRRRCAPPPGVDWFDVDFPAVIALRRRLLPDGAHLVGADVTTPTFLDELPRDRPTIALTNGLMLLLTADAFIGMARAITSHFQSGELAFNAYSRLAMRNSRRAARRMKSGPRTMPPAVGRARLPRRHRPGAGRADRDGPGPGPLGRGRRAKRAEPRRRRGGYGRGCSREPNMLVKRAR